MSAACPEGDETLDLQQELVAGAESARNFATGRFPIRLDDVLAGVLETAAKELEAEGVFFVSASQQLQARTRLYGEVPDDGSRWSEAAELSGYASAVLPGETIAHLVIYRHEPLSLRLLRS